MNIEKARILADEILNHKIISVDPIKAGMTNDSFVITCKENKDESKYVLRLNGVGTEKLIKRKNEETNYSLINDFEISDRVISINPEKGYKLTQFIEDARNCNPYNWEDVKACMELLRSFHELKIEANHSFDIFKEIEIYEALINNNSKYDDYEKVKNDLWKLRDGIIDDKAPKYLSHIDSVPDNFILTPTGNIYLIDWEYGASCNQLIDIAMFALYAGYNKEEVDRIIFLYVGDNDIDECANQVYAYIALGGLLWSNWCEYKESLGEIFGEYATRQYQYAKEFIKYIDMTRVGD